MWPKIPRKNLYNYKFIYSVAHTSGDEDDISVFKIVGGSSQFANADTALTQTAGTHETLGYID